MQNHSAEMDEIWLVFGEESRENLDLIEECLLKLENSPQDAELIAALFRSAHTLKGGARMMGLSVLERLSHRAEDLVALVRDEGVRLDSGMIGLLLEVLDLLRSLLDSVTARRGDADPAQVEGMVRALEEMIVARQGGTDKGAVEPSLGKDPCPEPPGPLPPLEEAITGRADPIRVERIDLSTDPVALRIFFEMAGEELERIRLGLETFARGGGAESLERIGDTAESLGYAAGQMGFQPLEGQFERLASAAREVNGAGQDKVETAARLEALERSLVEELRGLREQYSQPEPPGPQEANVDVPPTEPEPAPDPKRENSLSPDNLHSLLEIIGELVGEQSSLHHRLSGLAQTDLLGDVLRIVNIEQGDPQKTRTELEAYLGRWVEEIALLAQVENRVGGSLSRLQETLSELGVSLNRTIVDGMVVRAGRVRYLIPLGAIDRIARVKTEDLVESAADGHITLYKTGDEVLPVHELSEDSQPDLQDRLIVVVKGDEKHFALAVDELVGQQRALIHPLKGLLAGVRHVTGSALLGDGEIGMVLDPVQMTA